MKRLLLLTLILIFGYLLGFAAISAFEEEPPHRIEGIAV